MYLVMVNKDNLPQELVLVTPDLEKAQQHFLDTCSDNLSNWDEYTQDDKEALLDLGYENIVGNGAVVLIDTSNCITDDEIVRDPKGTVYYVWKELVTEGDTERLFTPWGDPQQHEFAMDLLFDTPQDARTAKVEYGAEDEDWILCKEILTPLENQNA